jgi:hypothetical protein
MAQIRIVDAWLRSPTAPPSHYRSVMAIAEKWAEQRVLMRAYAQSRDQTMPTILLHGMELAIGPAGIDHNGPWGIHVGEANPQAIKAGLEDAARRLAGSKGNPPRLADESQTFDREPTGNWAPGSPRVLPSQPAISYVTPAPAARVPQQQVATQVSSLQGHHQHDLRKTPLPRRRGGTHPLHLLGRTALGYASGSGAQSAVVRLGLAPHVSARLGRFIDRVVPSDFLIDAAERRILNALGEAPLLSARAIGQMLALADPVTFMEDLTKKLEFFGLGDLIEPGEPALGEPTYRMRT